MDKRVCNRIFCLLLGLIITVLPIKAQAAGTQETSPHIIVNLPSRTLELYEGDQLVKEYDIAIGKPSTPTPTGEFSILEKEVNPWWYPPGKGNVVPSGPNNPLGYRWMGVAPMYGIHGTNAPWSIGSAVSNGCMRMHEENVEDLFERVTTDTPVKIEYERVKVRVDAQGRASIGVYPDVYGRQRVTLADVKQKLTAMNLDGLVEDAFLQSIINRVPDQQVVFAQLHKLKVNGTLCPEHMVTWDNKKYVPVMALAASLQTSIEWNESNQTVSRQNHSAPGTKRGNTVYVASEYLPVLFGGREIWQQEQNCLELILPVAKLDGQLLTGDIHRMGKTLMVPALPLAKALGERVKWQPGTGELLIHGKPAASIRIKDQPFVAIDSLGSLYNLAAAWSEQTQTLELLYPLQPIDYSMYLDPGEEYL